MCFSVRRASSCNMHQPSLNGSSASSSCCFMGHLPLSLPAYQETLWWCWLEEGPWDLLGENTRWTHWEYTHSHIHINLKTWPYCSLFTHHDATELACSFLWNSGCQMSLIIHFQPDSSKALKWTRPVLQLFMAEQILLFQSDGCRSAATVGEYSLYYSHVRALRL